MKIDLPRIYNSVLSLRIYTPNGVSCKDLLSEAFETVEVPADTYLVICEAKDRGQKVLGSWGYDRTQWLPLKPEYHTPARLGPKPKRLPRVEVVEVKEETQPANDGPELKE
jgi:hypothetical protein